MFHCAYCWIERTLREKVVYPDELHERWQQEYDALQSVSERADWAEQKLDERNAINAVWLMTHDENNANPLLALAC